MDTVLGDYDEPIRENIYEGHFVFMTFHTIDWLLEDRTEMQDCYAHTRSR